MKSLTRLHGSRALLVISGCLPMLMTFGSQANDGGYYENDWYVGMNVGKSKATIDSGSIQTSLENNGFDVSSIGRDSSDEGFKVYLGHQFSRYIAVEGGYYDLGDFSFTANTLPATNFSGQTKLKGWNVDLVGTLPLTDRFAAFARLGLTRNESNTQFNSNGLIDTAGANQRDSYNKHKYGLGLQYAVSPAFTVRLEAERYRMDDLIGNHGDIDLYSLGVVYRFGKTSAETPTAAPAPAAVAAPVVAAPASKVEVLVLEDVHFDFDTAELNADTKEMLRQHVRTLKANPNARVRIAGYTSASGTKEYNQALSERRAESIKAFLVNEGIAANRFKTIGFGQSRPAEYEARPEELRSDAAHANMRGLFEIIVE